MNYKKSLLLILIVSIFSIFLFGIYLQLNSLSILKQSEIWPVTIGEIMRSDIHSRKFSDIHHQYKPGITYVYEVDGKSYSSTNFYLGQIPSGEQDEIQSIVERYPVGSDIDIKYDPDNPSYSFVIARLPENYQMLIGMFSACAFFILIMIIVHYRNLSNAETK